MKSRSHNTVIITPLNIHSCMNACIGIHKLDIHSFIHSIHLFIHSTYSFPIQLRPFVLFPSGKQDGEFLQKLLQNPEEIKVIYRIKR